MGWDGYYGGWAPYVPVAERRRRAAKKLAALKRKGAAFNPIKIEGRTISSTFWGKAWCENLESYSDYENRLPRGRTYVRNGSVMDLQITEGKVAALVSGSSLYKVTIGISPIKPQRWKIIKEACSDKIDSVVELLEGKLSQGVMEIITSKDCGLFPSPRQIAMDCSCPDWADMCKHVAAVLYGIGAKLDDRPELLFVLRKVDHMELISQVVTSSSLAGKPRVGKGKALAPSNLSRLFGIDINSVVVAQKRPANGNTPLTKRKNRVTP